MEDDREDDELVRVDLDAETVAHYARRAKAAGRTIEAQLLYELEVTHGVTVPDPGDVEATQYGQIFRRIRARQPLRG